MIVCICKNVNSRQIQECLEKGMSLEEISAEVGLGTGCGRCLDYANQIAQNESPLIARERPAA